MDMIKAKLTCVKCGCKFTIIAEYEINGNKLKCPKCGSRIFSIDKPAEIRLKKNHD